MLWLIAMTSGAPGEVGRRRLAGLLAQLFRACGCLDSFEDARKEDMCLRDSLLALEGHARNEVGEAVVRDQMVPVLKAAADAESDVHWGRKGASPAAVAAAYTMVGIITVVTSSYALDAASHTQCKTGGLLRRAVEIIREHYPDPPNLGLLPSLK
jgi:hypothetical protein